MSMSERVRKLRQQSLETKESLSSERAELLTDFYTGWGTKGSAFTPSIPIQRALAFQYLLEHKTISIGEGELIAGEKGPAPKAAPTYPELCCHSLQDLEILDSREKVFFRVDEEVKETYKNEIIPFWKGKSNRDKIMGLMTPEWLDAYAAGVFTEFQEQRAPGHTVLGYKMFNTGFLQLKDEIKENLSLLDFYNDPLAFEKHDHAGGANSHNS